jgi:2-oxoglutarate ferredoxin oxidoreductase subunit gamma
MVTHIPDRSDIQVVKVPAYEAAQELGNVKAANMILLGAYIEITRAVTQDSVLSAFTDNGMRPKLLKNNREAIEAGRRIVSGIRLESPKS